MVEELISPQEVADILKVKRTTIGSWISRGHIPAPDFKEKRFVRWKKSTIEGFIKDPYSWRRANCKD